MKNYSGKKIKIYNQGWEALRNKVRDIYQRLTQI